jgi:aminoglycoside 6'-N-acetyltransferase
MLTFQPATRDHLDLVNYRDSKQHVIDSDPESDRDREDELWIDIPGMWKYISYEGDHPIGFLQIIDPRIEPTQYRWPTTENVRAIDIWIGEETDLGKGYGTQMMQRAIQHCFSDPDVCALLVDPLAANTRSHRFYEKCGFVFVREEWFWPDHCFVYRLDRI